MFNDLAFVLDDQISELCSVTYFIHFAIVAQFRVQLTAWASKDQVVAPRRRLLPRSTIRPLEQLFLSMVQHFGIMLLPYGIPSQLFYFLLQDLLDTRMHLVLILTLAIFLSSNT